jgi:NADPH-dependent F420 reductase
MRIGIIGATGKQGSGLAVRWARAGHTIVLGSRDADKARSRAAELTAAGHGAFEGGDNASATGLADVVVLSVPYSAHEGTLHAIKHAAAGKIVIDVTVPLRPPQINRVHLPPGRAAAMEAQAILGEATPVAATLHHVSATHLADPSRTIQCDVLIATDDDRARQTALSLVRDLGLRGLDAGPLENAVALEALTAVLLHLNRKYKSHGAGIVFTNLPEEVGG